MTGVTTPTTGTSAHPTSAAVHAVADLGLPDLDAPRSQVLLAIADDALVTGHRAAHWTGVAPTLEEDLAFATIAQDGVNHADLWYQVLLGEDHPQRRAAVDALGLGRDPSGYRHAVLCAHEPRDFAFTLARQWVTTELDAARLDALATSPEGAVAALAVKLRHELRYHLEHAAMWIERLTADDEGHVRFRAALEAVLPEVAGFLEPVADEDDPDARGVLPGGHPGLRDALDDRLTARLSACGDGDLVALLDPPSPAALGGRAGRHGPGFTEDVWPEMTALYRAHPGARW
jgi:ring-1,2-phenylacetyl-CoA epoxidase subunit PaaC